MTLGHALAAGVATGAEHLVGALLDGGVDRLFGYPGGAVLPIYDALRDSALQHVLVRHEQGAALAADGYARASGRPGVCLATSGPGATNLVTGLANAMLDSVPVVAITGQVPMDVIGTDAFQEVDTLGITLPVVKHSFFVRDPGGVRSVVAEALALAQSGRPGPVLIDIPKDVQAAVAPVRPAPMRVPEVRPSRDLPSDAARRITQLWSGCTRPVCYAGGGIGMAGEVDRFRGLVRRLGLPVASTLKGLGVMDPSDPLHLGMLGMHGWPAANRAVQEADLLLCLGVRFDDRVTGRLERFAPGAAVVHCDVDPAELGKRRMPDVPVAGDLREVLPALSAALEPVEAHAAWRERCTAARAADLTAEAARVLPNDEIDAPALLRRVAQVAGAEAIVTSDVGQHQMWVAQHWPVARPERHLSSGGLGAMGYALPAAIGAQLACPGRTVVCVSGDGGFQMNLQELATAARYRLPVRIVLLDNRRLGMVRQWQELFLHRRYNEVDLSDNPDFVALAEAFGVAARAVTRSEGVGAAVEWLFSVEGPSLLHVSIPAQANVWPIVPPGHGNDAMLHAPRAEEAAPWTP